MIGFPWTRSSGNPMDLSSREIILAFSFTEIIDMTHMLHYDAMQDKRKIIVVLKETTYFRTFQMMADKTRIATNDFMVREFRLFIMNFPSLSKLFDFF